VRVASAAWVTVRESTDRVGPPPGDAPRGSLGRAEHAVPRAPPVSYPAVRNSRTANGEQPTHDAPAAAATRASTGWHGRSWGAGCGRSGACGDRESKRAADTVAGHVLPGDASQAGTGLVIARSSAIDDSQCRRMAALRSRAELHAGAKPAGATRMAHRGGPEYVSPRYVSAFLSMGSMANRGDDPSRRIANTLPQSSGPSAHT
jgi:hypothetical protein